MSVQMQQRLMTVEEYDRLPSDLRYDLIEGELIPMPPMPGDQHGQVTAKFSTRAGVFIEDRDLGVYYAAETRFLIRRNPDSSIAPDFAFTARARARTEVITGSSPVIPDLVLEVRSPSDSSSEAEAKMRTWIAAGVRLGWELNPRTQVLTIYRPGQPERTVDISGVIDGEDVLPGFTLPMRRLFPSREISEREE